MGSLNWKNGSVPKLLRTLEEQFTDLLEDNQRLEAENARLKARLKDHMTSDEQPPNTPRYGGRASSDSKSGRKSAMDKAVQSILGKIPYTIVRSDRRNTSEIQVRVDGITLRVPSHKSDRNILKLLENKRHWILEKYTEFQTIPKEKKHFKIRYDAPYITQRIAELALQVDVRVEKVIIKPLKTKWGSATVDGVITINSRLFRAPKHVIDYVIIHELCHLHIHDHSSAYWNLVVTHMPDYKKSIEWLKQHGHFI